MKVVDVGAVGRQSARRLTTRARRGAGECTSFSEAALPARVVLLASTEPAAARVGDAIDDRVGPVGARTGENFRGCVPEAKAHRAIGVVVHALQLNTKRMS